jgi:hypothetical protein
MFRELKTGVDILQQALDLRAAVIRRKRRRELLLDLLTFYYCLIRLVKNGRELLSLAGEEPLKTIMSLPPEETLQFSSKVYSLLLTQRLLLGKLSDLIYGQPIVEIFDAMLKAELHKLVNSKERGLLAVGAALEFYFMFGGKAYGADVEKHGQEIANFRYQSSIVKEVLYGNTRRVVNVNSATKNIDRLETAAEKLRQKINELFNLDEQLEFVKKAEEIASSI